MSEQAAAGEPSGLPTRMEWLSAMGIPVWLPRTPLPGAPDDQTIWKLGPGRNQAPSASLKRASQPVPRRPKPVAFSVAEDLPEAKRMAPTAITPADIGSAVPPTESQALDVSEPAAETGKPAVPVISAAPVRIAMDVRVGGGWMLVAEHGSGYWGEQERQFLADLMYACCGDAGMSASGPTFQWPPRDHERLERRGDLARDAMCGFLEKCTDTARVHTLLCVGSSLVERLIEGSPDTRVSVRGFPADLRRIALPGVREMLARPASKRPVWNTLSELVHGA